MDYLSGYTILSVIWAFFLGTHRAILSVSTIISRVWCQTHHDVTDKNDIVSFEGLDIHYH